MLTRPNFFIIGAPKCGTTALWSYLSTHPNISMSDPKEPHYFASDIKTKRITTEQQYLKCFKGIEERHTIVGESSVWYLFSKDAVPNIIEFNDQAKFIVMVRNPVDMAYSLHSQLVFVGHEDEIDFSKAWRLQDARARGENLPKFYLEEKLFQYGEVCHLGNQIERLYENVDKEQVKVIVFDEFAADPRKIYSSVMEFLSIEDDGRRKFPKINSNKIIKNETFEKLLNIERVPMLASLSRKAKAYFGIPHWGVTRPIAKLIRGRNITYRSREPMGQELREELTEYFKNDVGKLSDQLSKDLSSWLK